MKSVILRAPMLTQSGYGVHSRQITRWLIENHDQNKINLFCECVNWGSTPWKVNRDDENGLIGKVMDLSRPSPKNADISFQIQLPNEWDTNLAKFNIGITAGVETDICNPQWIESINKMDLIIVPSKFTKETFEKSGDVKTEIKVIPESFIDEVLETADLGIFDFNTSFNYMIFGQLTSNNPEDDRKNIFSTVKLLCDTFKDDENVGVILKTNGGRGTKIDRLNITKQVTDLISKIRTGSYPKIYLLHGDLSPKEVSALYKNKKIKGLVSLTRGEGYGLPLLEAAAADLPIIATNWSGHLDFLNQAKDGFMKVKYDLKELNPTRLDNNIFMKGARWAQPQEKSATEALLNLRKYPSIYQKRAQKLGKKIRENYSFEQIKKLYDEHCGDLI